MTESPDPDAADALPSPPVTGTVMIAVAERPGGRPCAIWADLDAGKKTVVAVDHESIQLLDALERSVVRTGAIQQAGGMTAATLAALGEAGRVRPRVEAWEGETHPSGERIRLPRPVERLTMTLGEALVKRRSVRSFSGLDSAQLSTLLYHAGRIKACSTALDGYEESTRPSPSAGARHPIDLIVSPISLEGSGSARLRPKSPYLFDPLSCELVAVEGPMAEAFKFCPDRAFELLGAMPAVVLGMVARPRRTFSRYRGGMSLVYRDAGALLATIGLVATSLGLAYCPLASVLQESSASDPGGDWVEVGGVALGGLLDE